MVEAYFDESGTDDGSPVMCVAGYLFEQAAAIKLTSEWVVMLEKYGIPYFHMSEVAPCKLTCAHMPMDGEGGCDALAREAYALIHKYMTIGFATSIETKYAHLIPTLGEYKNIYSFACWQALLNVRNWANDNRYHGKVSYVFEAGHDSQAESNEIMRKLFGHAFLKKAYRYAGHAFVEKRGGAPLLQCADILAWHITKNRRDQMIGRKSRGDYQALVHNGKHLLTHYGEQEIRIFADGVAKMNGQPLPLPHDWRQVMGLISYRIQVEPPPVRLLP